jgi:hypothetical protein
MISTLSSMMPNPSYLVNNSQLNVSALGEREAKFSKDPDIRRGFLESLFCDICRSWLRVSLNDQTQALQTWLHHRAACRLNTAPPSSKMEVDTQNPDYNPHTGEPIPLLAAGTSTSVVFRIMHT